jgi:hypothetical protein
VKTLKLIEREALYVAEGGEGGGVVGVFKPLPATAPSTFPPMSGAAAGGVIKNSRQKQCCQHGAHEGGEGGGKEGKGYR